MPRLPDTFSIAWFRTVVVATTALCLLSCGRASEHDAREPKSAAPGETAPKQATAPAITGAYDTTELQARRAAKDGFLARPGSPLPDSVRRVFTGLRYFPVAPALAVGARLERLPTPVPFDIVATKGDVRHVHRVGYLHFSIGDTPCRLAAYAMSEEKGSLFVPFRDATSGTETYDVGRYLDVEEAATDSCRLDFNMAYSPFCAYSANFTCPIVPEENVLTVAIRAGELAPAHHAH